MSSDGRLAIDEVLGPSSPLARRLSGYERRDGQLAMARAVREALTCSKHLFVEAGTGTGKTLAYLVPAILSGQKVVISTATHALQEQIFEKDLPLVREVLSEHGVTFRAALMKGLSNYLCKRRFEERLRSGEPVSPELAAIERWARETESGDRAELVSLREGASTWHDVASSTETRIGVGCKYYDECFVTRMRREAEDANVVVVNHHLFFADLALRTARGAGFGGALPPYDAVIFDEAHQMESVATDFFGVRVSTAKLDALVRDARRAMVAASLGDSASMKRVDDVEQAGALFFRSWRASLADSLPGLRRGAKEEGRRPLASSEWTPERREHLALFDANLEALAGFVAVHDRDDALAVVARRAREVRTDLARIARTEAERRSPAGDAHDGQDGAGDGHADDGFSGGVAWVDVLERSVALGKSPVDLGPVLGERLFARVPCVICTSATLATATHEGPSFHFAKSRLGAPRDTMELVVASPFDFAEVSALYVAGSLPEPSAPEFEAASADEVIELARMTDGGAFVLCTSTRAMKRIHERLRGRVPGPLLLQGEAPKHALLERFRASGRAVLVATMSFWEGVDVPGHALRLVVIDKIPFAVPTDPVVAARCARIEEEGGNPFMQYLVPSAAITLKQGFGRLIRTRKDMGIVALLDRRAVRRGYGKTLLASLPPARRLRSLDDARTFWDDLAVSGRERPRDRDDARAPEPGDEER